MELTQCVKFSDFRTAKHKKYGIYLPHEISTVKTKAIYEKVRITIAAIIADTGCCHLARQHQTPVV
jgi:hypothetical protein